ncbi:MAG TPA: TIGR04282 family arsenosugar biosynthesis glycosyltransferase [Rubrivivax sp.]|nr:TIGR04282 family arsenosugar biosynthesis glycosyltransferase [Rubrivivax sp.]
MSTALIVFARAPVPGQAKTRLIPALGAGGAAALAERLLAHTVDAAASAGFDHVELCVTPDASHPAIRQLARQHGLALTTQGDGDLGARMHRALARSLQQHAHALLIGSDVPGLDAACLRQADAALATHDAVFVPALDGGYALVGLRRAAPHLFDGMRWSTPRVMQHTRRRAAAAGLRVAELPPLPDIDEPADLAHLPAGWLQAQSD